MDLFFAEFACMVILAAVLVGPIVLLHRAARPVLSDFRMIRIDGTSVFDWEFFAEVRVRTWLRSRVRMIYRSYGGSWVFVDTGKFTPGYDAEELYRAWNAGSRFRKPGVGPQ